MVGEYSKECNGWPLHRVISAHSAVGEKSPAEASPALILGWLSSLWLFLHTHQNNCTHQISGQLCSKPVNTAPHISSHRIKHVFKSVIYYIYKSVHQHFRNMCVGGLICMIKAVQGNERYV